MQNNGRTFESLSEDEMSNAMMRADGSYDGLFYTGVLTTGIYCLPSCTCRKPDRRNVRFFPSRQAAEGAGLRPCMRCRPELEGGRGAYEASIVAQARRLVEDHLDGASISGVAADLALSPHHLMRVFRRVAGKSLGAYIREQRVARAARLLGAGESSILEVSAASGFGSLSSLYSAFGSAMHLPPGRYRRAMSADVVDAS